MITLRNLTLESSDCLEILKSKKDSVTLKQNRGKIQKLLGLDLKKVRFVNASGEDIKNLGVDLKRVSLRTKDIKKPPESVLCLQRRVYLPYQSKEVKLKRSPITLVLMKDNMVFKRLVMTHATGETTFLDMYEFICGRVEGKWNTLNFLVDNYGATSELIRNEDYRRNIEYWKQCDGNCVYKFLYHKYSDFLMGKKNCIVSLNLNKKFTLSSIQPGLKVTICATYWSGVSILIFDSGSRNSFEYSLPPKKLKVAVLKKHIKERFGIEPWNQAIYVQSKRLDDKEFTHIGDFEYCWKVSVFDRKYRSERAAKLRKGEIIVAIQFLTRKIIDFKISNKANINSVKSRIHDIEGIPPDQQNIIFKGLKRKDTDILRSEHIKNNSTLYLIFKRGISADSNMFVDVAHPKEQRREWKNNGPRWRRIDRGLVMEGYCRNTYCVAINKQVCCTIDKEVVDVIRDKNKFLCPICNQRFEPLISGFNNCCYKIISKKYSSPDICELPWKKVENNYEDFSVECSDKVGFEELRIFTNKSINTAELAFPNFCFISNKDYRYSLWVDYVQLNCQHVFTRSIFMQANSGQPLTTCPICDTKVHQ